MTCRNLKMREFFKDSCLFKDLVLVTLRATGGDEIICVTVQGQRNELIVSAVPHKFRKSDI